MYCPNCGKKLPEGAAGPLCEACAAEKQSNSPEAPKERQTASQLLKSSKGGKGAKKAVKIAGKAGLKGKLLAAVAGVTAACAILGFGAYAVFGETKEEKIHRGITDLVTLEDQYNLLTLARTVGSELEAFSKEGGSRLEAQLVIPGEGTAELALGLKRNGKKTLVTLEGDLLGVDLEPTRLYFDNKQAALDPLGADQYFSVNFEDLAKSLVASGTMTAPEAEALWDDTVQVLTDGADLYEDVREALETCLDEALPEKLAEKEGKTEWSGHRYTAYTLRMTNEDVVRYLQTLGDKVMADETLRPWLEDALSAGQYAAGITETDLNPAWAQLRSDLADLQFFNSLKLTAYFDGSTCVGFEGKVTNLMGERSDLAISMSHIPDDEGIFDRKLECVLVDRSNREYGLRYKGTWTGNDLSCTEEGVLTLMQGGYNQVIDLKLEHRLEDETAVDLLTVQGVTFEHRLEGDPEGKQFTATYYGRLLGYKLDLTLDYSKGDDSVKSPKSTKLTDGSAQFFDQKALEKLEDVLYDLEKVVGRLEDKLDF